MMFTFQVIIKHLNSRNSSVLAGLFCLVLSVSGEEPKEFSRESIAFFESKIRPVFAEQCYRCHSHDAKKLKGGLYMDSRQGLLKGGDTDAAIVVGDPKSSLLVEAIHYEDPDLQMPPKSKLSPQQIKDIEKWIAEGAAWPKEAGPAEGKEKKGFDLASRQKSHWSWKALGNPAAPEVKNKNWSSHPVDKFILDRLEKENIQPAKQADRLTLIRRVYFVLHGIPPTPQEIDAFLKDDRPYAFERLVDQLLESPRFGERWARHWLDLVRYAESRGHEFDYNAPNAYRYRDYVIRAFNEDVPYDQFVHEHIAGDLLPNPRMNQEENFNESILGTGFWFLGEWVHSPVDTRQDEADRYDNMIDVATKTFLGLTVACARCHDHKFDAISTKDYYAFSGFLQSSNYRQVRYESIEHNRGISQKLDELEQTAGKQAWQAWLTELEPKLQQTENYLLAAKQILDKGVSYDVSDVSLEPEADITFEDFEDGTYLGWTTIGDAFGKGPVTEKTKAPYQINTNQQGTYFVNSHYLRDGGRGDGHKGTLTSEPFKIERDYITFLIGGGSHLNQTCLNLMIDGKVVTSATGDNNNTMSRKFWDVRQFRGKKGVIQAVDNHTSGWGNMGFDDVIFTNHKPKGAKPGKTVAILKNFSAKTLSQISSLAEQEKLSANTLKEWVGAMLTASDNPQNPLYALTISNTKKTSSNIPTEEDFQEALKHFEPVIDYSNAPDHHFLQDGFTFGQRVIRQGDVLWGQDIKKPVWGVAHYSMARKDPSWHDLRIVDSVFDAGSIGFPRAGMTLRTPTFTLKPTGELKQGRVRYLVRGEATALAVVNSHRLVQGPLHGNTKADIGKPGELSWYSHSLDRKGQSFIGERMHIEFIPKGKEFEVLMVVQGHHADSENTILRYLNASSGERLSKSIANKDSVSARIRTFVKELPKVGLNWVLENPNLFPEANPAASSGIKTFISRRNELVSQIQKDSRTAMAMQDGVAENEHVFIRGNPRTLGEEAPRRFLKALGGKPIQAHGSGRLELAQQMTSPSNPYTSRVLANRVWHHLFGRGIVPTTNDFGVLGQMPSHPELLDHISTTLVQKDWSTKQLIRYLLTSKTWQMSSSVTDRKVEEKDPTNKLWHRMPIRRKEGEIIRDSLLALSGKLKEQLYGKPTPIYLNSFMTGRGRPGNGPLDGNGRRSIYLSVRRNFLSPMMLAFDTPSPFNSVGRRTVSNVPSQALMMMNDPFIRSQTKIWGEQFAKDEKPVPERIKEMYLQAYCRHPKPVEHKVISEFMDQQLKTDPANAWSNLAHVLITAKEFIYVH